MTASININKYWCDGGKTFEMWLNAYGFKIIDDDADVVVIDYDTWKDTHPIYKDDALIVILSSYTIARMEIPPNALFKLIPIDYPITIEYIIELLEAKTTTV